MNSASGLGVSISADRTTTFRLIERRRGLVRFSETLNVPQKVFPWTSAILHWPKMRRKRSAVDCADEACEDKTRISSSRIARALTFAIYWTREVGGRHSRRSKP